MTLYVTHVYNGGRGQGILRRNSRAVTSDKPLLPPAHCERGDAVPRRPKGRRQIHFSVDVMLYVTHV